MKKQIHEMKLNNAPWIAIKKNKKSIELRLNDEKRKKINVGDSIIFTNVETGKKLKRKVKRLHSYPNFQELYQNFSKKKLGYSKKEEANYQDMEKHYSKEDIEKYGVLGIELKQKHHILLKILLVLLVMIGLYFLITSINKVIMKANDKKINAALEQVEKEKIEFIFIEINPSFALTLKENKVNNIACLNDDCMKIYEQIDILGKNITDSINDLYNLAKEKGFDTSKGVTVKAINEVKIENLDYVTVEYIDEDEKEELLNNVKNNEKIKNSNNDNYYTLLWEELKKDKDYGKLYDCSMNEKVLECYFKENAFPRINEEDINPTNFMIYVNQVLQGQKDVARVLNKFKIQNEKESDGLIGSVIEIEASYVTIGGIKFHCGASICRNYDLDTSFESDTVAFSYISNFNGEKGLNLLDPTEILNRLSFGDVDTGTSALQHYKDEKKMIFLQKSMICDKNKQNCTREIFSLCDDQQANGCRYIDKATYEQLKEEYMPSEIGDEPNASGAGCETHDVFNPTEGICSVRDKEDENKKIAYYRCKNNSMYKKDCTPITKEIYDQYYKTRTMCSNMGNGKFSCNFDNNAIGSSDLICDVDLNTFKISNCVSYDDYYGN